VVSPPWRSPPFWGSRGRTRPLPKGAQDIADEARPGDEVFSIWGADVVEKGMGVDPNGGTLQGVTRPTGDNQ
jgi:hypothetical protein